MGDGEAALTALSPLSPQAAPDRVATAAAISALTVRTGEAATRRNTVLTSFGVPLRAGAEGLTIDHVVPASDETETLASMLAAPAPERSAAPPG